MRVQSLALGFTVCAAIGCGSGSSDPVRIQGVVQKGPLVSGSAVEAYELDAALRPTGRTFSTVTTDDLGHFSLDVESASGLVEVVASGKYYDEVSGDVSPDPVTLHGVADVSDDPEVHVNVLTQLTRDRIFQLAQSGELFADAKAQAESEVAELFDAAGLPTSGFERLDLSEPGSANASLLAVSAALVDAAADRAAISGNVTEEVSRLLSDLSDDLEADGRVAGALKDPLERSYRTFDVQDVAANMEARYQGFDSSGFAEAVNRPPVADPDWVADYGPLTIEADTANREARVSWPAVDGAASYLLRWTTARAGWGADVADSGVVAVAGTESLLARPRFTEYTFRLAAVRSDGAVAAPSAEQPMTSFDQLAHYPGGTMCTDCHLLTADWGQPDGVASLLKPPADVAASPGPEAGSVSLSWKSAWTASPRSLAVPWPWPIEYRVYASTSPGVTIESGRLGSTSTTTYAHRGVQPGQTYYYRVLAVSENGHWSRMSPEVSVTAVP